LDFARRTSATHRRAHRNGSEDGPGLGMSQ
jgi:hypothetical protein